VLKECGRVEKCLSCGENKVNLKVKFVFVSARLTEIINKPLLPTGAMVEL